MSEGIEMVIEFLEGRLAKLGATNGAKTFNFRTMIYEMRNMLSIWIENLSISAERIAFECDEIYCKSAYDVFTINESIVKIKESIRLYKENILSETTFVKSLFELIESHYITYTKFSISH